MEQRSDRASTSQCFLLIFVTLSLATLPAYGQAEDVRQVAREHHERGVALFGEGNYREAAQAFEQAEQLVANPLNRYNQARCHQELEEYDLALAMLDRYLESERLSAADRADAEQLRAEVLGALQQPPSPEPTEPEPEPVVPEPVPEPDTEPESRPGEDRSPQAPAPELEARRLIGPWVVIGLGLASMLTGGVLDIVAYVRSEREDGERFDDQDHEAWRSEALTLAIAGDVLLGVGVAAAVAGLVWLLVDRSRRARGTVGATSLTVMTGSQRWLMSAVGRF
jgi:tetratricopeptide (TPR) repeat protein